MMEDEARAIHEASNLSQFSYEQCKEADQWVRQYAMGQLRNKLMHVPTPIADYVKLMCHATYGSTETDEFLTAMGCYPHWL